MTEKELINVGKEQYLKFLWLIKSYLLGSDGILPARLQIPGSEIARIENIKIEETINHLINDFVLQRFVFSYEHEPDEYFSYIWYGNYAGQLLKPGSPRLIEHSDLLIECRMSVTDLDRYTTNIQSLGTIKHLPAKMGYLIYKDEHGDYFYNGEQINIPQETIYYRVFDALYMHRDQKGFLSYGDIEKYLIKAGENESGNETKRNKRINNATNKQQGIFRYAKVGDGQLKNETLRGQELIETIRGEGLKLNNPKI
jgi:hypothetical protein